jgi:hypothetical protein
MLSECVGLANMLAPSTKQGFANTLSVSDVSNMSTTTIILTILFMILYIILVLLLGKWLFNSVLCVLFPCVAKATSIWQMLGLMILFHLLLP